jgi:hypothetical protein
MTRPWRGVFLLGGFAITAAVAAQGFAAEGNKCTIATKGDSPVAQACAKGGVKLAKATMKDLVKKAKDNGVKFDCDKCHKNEETFELEGDARDNFRKLLAAQTK